MSSPEDAWEEFNDLADHLSRSIKQVSAININSKAVKDKVKHLVEFYFRSARPNIIQIGIGDTELVDIDNAVQELNRLRQGNNRKKGYSDILRKLKKQTPQISIMKHLELGRQINVGVSATSLQAKIITTLKQISPPASDCFEQAISDLHDEYRKSYRGTAADLREALRETIDYLAPNDNVVKSTGFKFEKDQLGKNRTTPTMRQKVQFILKSRGRSSNEQTTAIETMRQIEISPDALARSIYNQGSSATHMQPERRAVNSILRYTEVLLADLLELD